VKNRGGSKFFSAERTHKGQKGNLAAGGKEIVDLSEKRSNWDVLRSQQIRSKKARAKGMVLKKGLKKIPKKIFC